MSKNSPIVLGVMWLTSAGCDPGWSEPTLLEDLGSSPIAYYSVPRISGERGRVAVVYGWPGPHPSIPGLPAESTTELHAVVLNEAPGPSIYLEHTDLVSHDVTDSGKGEVTIVYNTESSGLFAAQWAEGVWATPVAIASAGTNPRLVSDESGNVLAVWNDAGRARAAYLAVDASGVWETAVDLNGAKADDLSSVNVAMNSNGDAIAAWCESTARKARVITRRFWRETGWDASTERSENVPECLGGASQFGLMGRMNTVDVAITDAGVASVAWTDGDLQFVQHRSAPGWSPVTTLVASADVEHPKLAVSRRGSLIVGWMDAGVIAAKVFSSGTWGPAVVASKFPGNPSYAVGIATNGTGMLACVEGSSAKVARLDRSGLIETDTVAAIGAYEVDLAVRPDGFASLAIGHAQSSVLVSQYRPE